MKIGFLYIGSSLSPYGFRKLGSIARQFDPTCQLHFLISKDQHYNSLSSFLGLKNSSLTFTPDEFRQIAETFSEMDIIAISSMSLEASLVRQLTPVLRKANPRAIILWGGVHAIIAPEDCIPFVDGICTNEGELAFHEILQHIEEGRSYLDVRNFWFNLDGNIIRNPMRPLMNSKEMTALPFPHYGENERIYQKGRGFRMVTVRDHLKLSAMCYNTIWTRGCPFKCTYCSNNKFLSVDREYGKIRYPSIDHIIGEIKAALSKHPHLQSIAFYDDCLISLSPEILHEFAKRFKEEICLPFAVYGLTPVHIKQEKVEILLSGGLNRVRMGIQSGSDKILKFYKRPNRKGMIKESINILAGFKKRIIPPAYDIILDNPVETQSDVHDTLLLVNNMPRPFTLNIFSLRSIPNTELEQQLKEIKSINVSIGDVNYLTVAPTFANILLYIVSIVHLPATVFKFFLRFCKPAHESRKLGRWILIPFQLVFLFKRVIYHICFRDFSVTFGRTGYFLWKRGFLKTRR